MAWIRTCACVIFSLVLWCFYDSCVQVSGIYLVCAISGKFRECQACVMYFSSFVSLLELYPHDHDHTSSSLHVPYSFRNFVLIWFCMTHDGCWYLLREITKLKEAFLIIMLILQWQYLYGAKSHSQNNSKRSLSHSRSYKHRLDPETEGHTK